MTDCHFIKVLPCEINFSEICRNTFACQLWRDLPFIVRLFSEIRYKACPGILDISIQCTRTRKSHTTARTHPHTWVKYVVNKHVSPPYFRAEMYAGRVACCPLASHDEYADGTDRQKDRRHTVIPLRTDAADSGGWSIRRHPRGIRTICVLYHRLTHCVLCRLVLRLASILLLSSFHLFLFFKFF